MVTPAFAAARLVSVFLTTAYVVSRPSARRNSVTCLTVKPRYSVMTAAEELVKCSVISATALIFSEFGMCFLLSYVSGWLSRQHRQRNAPAQSARGGDEAEPSNLRGPLRRSGCVRSRART